MSELKSNAFSQKALRTQDPPISWLMKLALQRPGLISLAAGFTDSPSLPAEPIREILDELWNDPSEALAALQYGTTQGDEELRKWTRDRIARMDGLGEPRFSEQQVVVGNGSQQLLSFATEALCDPGDIILLEDPTYFVYLGVLESCGARAVPFSGLDELEARLDSLRSSRQLGQVKLAYAVSYHRNPTGSSLSAEAKAKTLSLLRSAETGRPIYLLEDAAYRDLRFDGPDIPSFLAHDPAAERVIYTATYTKPFSTGLKVGYGIFPQELVAPVLRFKGNEDFGTSHLDQQILRRALRSGRYERHLEKLRSVYRGKAALMDRCLREHFPAQARWKTPSGGLYFWVEFAPDTDCGLGSKIFENSLNADVLYVPGELCYAETPLRRRPRHQMRLSFGSAAPDRIEEGVRRLGQVLRSYLG